MFQSSSGVRQGAGCVLLPGEKLFHHECMDGIDLLCYNTQAIHIAFNHLPISVRKCSMLLASRKCKLLLQDCQECIPGVTLCGKPLKVVEEFVDVGNSVSARGVSIKEQCKSDELMLNWAIVMTTNLVSPLLNIGLVMFYEYHASSLPTLSLIRKVERL